MMSESIWS
ncbi:hypothetical protein VCHENC02_1873A, partial [Vibrio harveyi]